MTTSKIDDGGPAFPRDHAADGHNGMALRDYFAATASDEDIDCLRAKIKEQREITTDSLGKHYEVLRAPSNWRQLARYMHADLMIAARKEAS